MRKKKPANEYLTGQMLEDLGFVLLESDKEPEGKYDWSFEVGYSHRLLEPVNLILVDYNNGCWHFAQRKHAIGGIGKMLYLDDLLSGFSFVTEYDLITQQPKP